MDPTSTSPIELGTITHPYKHLDDPLHEIYAFFYGAIDVEFQVLIREGTSAHLFSQVSILQAKKLTITSYSVSTDTPEKATFVFSTEAYSKHWSTRFLLTEGIVYEHFSKLMLGHLQPYEFGISQAFKATRLFIVRSNVLFTNLNFLGRHENYALTHIRPVNLQSLSLQFVDNYIETTGDFVTSIDNLQLSFVGNTANLTNSQTLI